MPSRLVAVAAAAASATCLLAAVPGTAGASSTPASISGVTSSPGPRAGEVTIHWRSSGANTAGFRIETGLSTFSPSSSSSLPRHGRQSTTFSVGRSARAVTLSAAQVASAGAAPQTAAHLYFRLFAVNGSAVRAYPYLQAVIPRAATPHSSGTAVRVASFNVRTAKATQDARNWLARSGDVAAEIERENPGVVAIQELSPGRADGRAGTTNGAPRQTDSMESAMRGTGAGRYQLVRTTSYVKPGVTHGTQGARLLYDTSRFDLVSRCPEMTGSSHWNGACSLELPLLSGDGESNRRSAAYAEFRSRATGKHFWVVSVHLDARHSSSLTAEKRYQELRRAQVARAYAKVTGLAGGNPVIIAGDFNSWQNNRAGHQPHDYLVNRGFYDSAGAVTKVNIAYPTINDFATTLKPGMNGYGVRIDAILSNAGPGARRFENVMKVTDSSRPSDHNMIVADLVL
ncbi:MAG: hypothetical protein JWP61_2598 [Friedmanniella sp.]|nr:hypothetical protein [Friedmanniella sp.]